jgi:hypothetical protein
MHEHRLGPSRARIGAALLSLAVAGALPIPGRSDEAAPAPAPPDTTAPVAADSVAAPDSTATAEPRDALVVYYFHQTVRCADCILIEAYTRDVLELDFTAALADGRVRMRAVDVEAEANRELAARYEVSDTALVLSRRSAGQEVDWIVLDQVWDLVEDSIGFADYLRTEIAAALLE